MLGWPVLSKISQSHSSYHQVNRFLSLDICLNKYILKFNCDLIHLPKQCNPFRFHEKDASNYLQEWFIKLSFSIPAIFKNTYAVPNTKMELISSSCWDLEHYKITDRGECQAISYYVSIVLQGKRIAAEQQPFSIIIWEELSCIKNYVSLLNFPCYHIK